jgi:hypothetical protein
LALSDHNILSQGQNWMSVKQAKGAGKNKVVNFSCGAA